MACTHDVQNVHDLEITRHFAEQMIPVGTLSNLYWPIHDAVFRYV